MRNTIRIINDDDVMKIFHYTKKSLPMHRAIMALGLLAGLRRREIIGLEWRDIIHNSRVQDTLTVRPEVSKNRHRRYVDIPQPLIDILSKLRTTMQILHVPVTPDTPVIVTPNFRAPYTGRACVRVVRNITLAATGTAYTCHELRHTYATRLLKCSNLRIVQQQLGHRNIQTTQIYTHPDRTERLDALRRAFEEGHHTVIF